MSPVCNTKSSEGPLILEVLSIAYEGEVNMESRNQKNDPGIITRAFNSRIQDTDRCVVGYIVNHAAVLLKKRYSVSVNVHTHSC